jgi:chemotaxis signal transduction protein
MNFERKQQSLLTFRVGPVLCCAPSLPVRSIISPPKLTHPPGSDSSQPGIFKHGSHIVKVLDLRQKFGIDEVEQTQPGNLIITIFEKESFAFWVDQILDVFDFPSEGWGNLPAAIPRGIFTRTLLLNKKIHLYSEFENLATINDLGYLKHYIQQLKTQNEIKPSEKNDKHPNLEREPQAAKVTDKKEGRDSTILISEKTNLTNSGKETPSINNKNENNKTISKPIKKPTPSIKNKLVPEKQKANTVKVSSPFKGTTQHTSSNKNSTLQKETRNTTPIEPKTSISKPISQVHSKTEAQQVNHPEKKVEEKPIPPIEDSSSTGIILFFLFLFLLLGSGLYYVFFSEQENNDKNKYQAIKPIQTEKKPTEEVISQIIENEVSVTEETQVPEDKEYKADISQQENEITITIHQPSSVESTPVAEEEKEEKEENKSHVIETEADIIKPENSTIEIQVEKFKEKELNKAIPKQKITNEVIHIVVKGDTLWAIAKKYVHNPYLYPELARLSNIKNPHRIYPGNRVRIRFIKY